VLLLWRRVFKLIPIKVRKSRRNSGLEITIPYTIRQKFNINKGDVLLMVADGDTKQIMLFTKEQVFRGLVN
jgi:hypothetical protein